MRVSQLFSIYSQYRVGEDAQREIVNLTNDSRQVKTGSVYVAIRGHRIDGHHFLAEVCAAGATAVVVEDASLVPNNFKGAVVEIENSRVELDRLAAKYFGNPAQELYCVGVTGTNGKTSTTYLIEAILNEFGLATGVMGTINHHFKNTVWESELTTPDSLVLQKRLAEFRAMGAKAAAFEVSSHALSQHRADHIPFDAVVFTNLTRDHLDYHRDMEDYFFSKQKLFNEVLNFSNKTKLTGIVNIDDGYGKKLKVTERAKIWTYGQSQADFKFKILKQSYSDTEFELDSPHGPVTITLPMVGNHNVYNAVAAIAVALSAGASLQVCESALKKFTGVPGRLQAVQTKLPFHVLVDYAHTDDALRNILLALKDIRSSNRDESRIITVFGCGGDRDKGKRPLMTHAALANSDLVYVTSDNPRTEDPEKIIDDCMAQVPVDKIGKSIFRESDRRRAIHLALQNGRPGDVIVIAGKGHEDYQIIGTEKRPLSDVGIVEEWSKTK